MKKSFEFIRSGVNSSEEGHGCYLALKNRIIGDLVLDNCAGSGSTLVAAKNLNRNFIGIEKEQQYYDICLERLK